MNEYGRQLLDAYGDTVQNLNKTTLMLMAVERDMAVLEADRIVEMVGKLPSAEWKFKLEMQAGLADNGEYQSLLQEQYELERQKAAEKVLVDLALQYLKTYRSEAYGGRTDQSA